MTSAATPELEIAEANFKNAKFELSESDRNYQMLGVKIDKTKF